MPELTISDSDITSLKGKVVIVTGCASGIGLATVQEALKIGSKVVGGDLSLTKPSIDSADFEYVRVDVTDWKALVNLFNKAVEKFGHVDHVFANAGIRGQMKLLDDEFDENGDLKRPDYTTFNVNLTSVVDTLKLGIHHIRKNPKGGSVVAIASASSFQRFPLCDYASAKAGVHGLVRGMWSEIGPQTEVPVRFNGIAPSWTITNLLDDGVATRAGLHLQPAEAAARSALLLMADEKRHGEMIFSQHGKYLELESHLLPATEEILRSAPGEFPRTRTEAADCKALYDQYLKEM